MGQTTLSPSGAKRRNATAAKRRSPDIRGLQFRGRGLHDFELPGNHELVKDRLSPCAGVP
jgi:hypothetical protein